MVSDNTRRPIWRMHRGRARASPSRLSLSAATRPTPLSPASIRSSCAQRPTPPPALRPTHLLPNARGCVDDRLPSAWSLSPSAQHCPRAVASPMAQRRRLFVFLHGRLDSSHSFNLRRARLQNKKKGASLGFQF
ncbi:hypothetical protein L1887_47871 [Cichorium endivia]|nr:hypothetical protein L1887_47871 [Cichorium endivia]